MGVKIRSLGLRSKFVQIYNVKNSGSSTDAYTTSFNELFAGDAYVDCVGIDDYNRYNVSYSYWAFPGANLLGAYRQVTSMSNRFNSAPSSGVNSRAKWLVDYARLLMTPQFNRVVMATLFVQDKSSEGSGNWFISSNEEFSAVNEMLKIFRSRPKKVPIGANLLPVGITSSLSNWTRVGSGTLEVSTDTPDSFDPTEFSIKYTKPVSTLGTPESFNFYYLPTDSIWTPGKSFYLSFYAKASVNTRITVGTRRNTSPFEYSVDFFVDIGTAVNDLTGLMRLPFFAFGRVSDALDFYVAGIKFERGQYPTSRLIPANQAVFDQIIPKNGNEVLLLGENFHLQSTGSTTLWLEADANNGLGESEVPGIVLTSDGNRILSQITNTDAGSGVNYLDWRQYSNSGSGGVRFSVGGSINLSPAGQMPTVTTAPTTALTINPSGASTTSQIPVQFRPPNSVMTAMVILDNNNTKLDMLL